MIQAALRTGRGVFQYCALATLLSSCFLSARADTGASSVAGVAGLSAETTISGIPAKVGATVLVGDRVETSNGAAEIMLGKGGKVSLGRGTRLSFIREQDQLTAALERGGLTFSRPPDAPNLRIRIGNVSIQAMPGVRIEADVLVTPGMLTISARRGALAVEGDGTEFGIAEGEAARLYPDEAGGPQEPAAPPQPAGPPVPVGQPVPTHWTRVALCIIAGATVGSVPVLINEEAVSADPGWRWGVIPGGAATAGFICGLVDKLRKSPFCIVVEVKFTPLNSPLDANPNTGGGQRIFAEKPASDKPLANEVNVVATVWPAAPGKIVYFKNFDVDDPSTDAAPVDPNGPRGNDNRGVPQAGTLTPLQAITNAAGIATVKFATTIQPGDNFKVAASCNKPYLESTRLNDPNGSQIIDAERKVLPTPVAKLTDMLTVWRRVHVEPDFMQAVTGNFYRGTVTAAATVPWFNMSFVSTNLAAMEAGRLEHGRIVITGDGAYPITANTGNMIISSGVPATAVGKAFTAYDDDDYNGSDGANKHGDDDEALVAPDRSLVQDSDTPANNVFAPGYVRPTYDLPNPTHPAFVLNQIGDAGADVVRLYGGAFDNQAKNQNEYWVVYMLGAYQPITAEDQDPDTEGITTGRVDALRGLGGVTYLECVSAHELAANDKKIDASNAGSPNIGAWKQSFRNAETTAHEMGHLFGGRHTDRGLMSDQIATIYLTFSPTTLDAIRSTLKP
jgi:hypothetical protein